MSLPSQLQPSLSRQHLYTPRSDAGPSSRPFDHNHNDDEMTAHISTPKPRGLKGLGRPWMLGSGSGRRKSESLSRSEGALEGDRRSVSEAAKYHHVVRPTSELRIGPPYGQDPSRFRAPSANFQRKPSIGPHFEESDEGTDVEPDAYSWVDPSLVGSLQLGATPRRTSRSEPPSPGGITSRTLIAATQQPLQIPLPPNHQKPQRPGRMDPADSYNLLLAYQTSTSSHGSSPPVSPIVTPYTSTEAVHVKKSDPEWYEMVDPGILESLGRQEVNRQGLWWELIKAEVEYVRDLRIICDGFIQPLREHNPPLLSPENRLNAFIAEVFSTIPQLLQGHERLLEKLLARQRFEWPLMTSATDVLLETYLEVVDLYETYMKNYPFAEARVRREGERNAQFRSFLSARNTTELTRRRDVSVFLSRPITRMPRVLLLLDALLRVTPPDHPDKEAIPTVTSILTSALKGSQPGIESAEAKIKLWNVAEKLLFKKGEIIELDIGEPKRTLVHAGYVLRRVRSETNWHGWQDLHAFLLDNYFLLTRDEEQGKHVVVSRPIHLDFLELISADGVPERRYDYISVRRRHSGNGQETFQPERLMFPFTISSEGAVHGRQYTLCVASQAARDQWKEKIENAKTLRKFDLESNKIFAIHTLFIPPTIKEPMMAADTFTWLGRETVAIATPRSVWIGWRRNSLSYRELITFSRGMISSITIVPDFGWLLVLVSGTLIAFNLRDMVPTHEPVTWSKKLKSQGTHLNGQDQNVAFTRLGVTKDRLLVVHASYAKASHQTNLTFDEPLRVSIGNGQDARPAFRRFATLHVPGYASELSFFRQTIAVVAEKAFVIAEPGNPTHNSIPTFPANMSQNTVVARIVAQAKPMAMYQTGENEFLLAYDWGACFVTKYGEVSRNGSFMRWNITPSYIAFRPPHLLLFDEYGGRAEVRNVITGKVCEVIQERGMKALRLSRSDQGMLAISPRGLLDIVETFELR